MRPRTLLSTKFWIASLLLALPLHVLGAHPFVTDDTTTQGRGNQQWELNTDWSRQHEATQHVANATYSYGVLDNLDLFTNLPATLSAPAGIGDVSLGAKWRFYEDAGSSLGLKPVLQISSGNQAVGNGSGRTNLALTLIGTRYAGPWALHANLGIASNRQAANATQAGEHQLLWQASAALSYDLHQRWKMLADLGIARNPDPASRIHPAYFLTGLIYSPNKDIDLDAGAKFGLNRAASQQQFGVGLTWRF